MIKTDIFLNIPLNLGEEIKAEVSYIIVNDGIGAYEFWGQMCYDQGTDYPEIEDIIPIFTDQSKELELSITNYILENFDSLSEQAETKIEIKEY